VELVLVPDTAAEQHLLRHRRPAIVDQLEPHERLSLREGRRRTAPDVDLRFTVRGVGIPYRPPAGIVIAGAPRCTSNSSPTDAADDRRLDAIVLDTGDPQDAVQLERQLARTPRRARDVPAVEPAQQSGDARKMVAHEALLASEMGTLSG